jgi:hypothetical protein
MGASSRYWKIWRINPSRERLGYEYRLITTAQEFVHFFVPNSHNGDVQCALLSHFYAKNLPSSDIASHAQAGLCLRCYVSDPILKACQKIDSLFGGEKSFSYQDLLPFVLNDDGKTLVVLDSDRKTQLILNDKGETKTTGYKFFSVKVLQTFNAESQSRMSLDNWAYLQTKQHRELKDFLSEFGFKHLSDWALLNRTRLKQLQLLGIRDRHLIEVFHSIYRRDRQKQRQVGVKKCPDPTSAQMQEMLGDLQQRGVFISTSVELLQELKQVATQLRQFDIWSYRESLEIEDPETHTYKPRPDLPYQSLDEVDIEHGEILDFLHEELELALNEALEQEIRDRIAVLQKSKKYDIYAQEFISGLQLYYCQALSLKEIAPLLGMTSWDQARRVLNPGELLGKVRALTVQYILSKVLEKAHQKGLTTIPPEPNYLKVLVEQMEAFVDEEIFQEAAEEIRAGKSRSMDSLYAQKLRQTLNNLH